MDFCLEKYLCLWLILNKLYCRHCPGCFQHPCPQPERSIFIKVDCWPLVTSVTTTCNLPETGSCLWSFRHRNDCLFLEYSSCLKRMYFFFEMHFINLIHLLLSHLFSGFTDSWLAVYRGPNSVSTFLKERHWFRLKGIWSHQQFWVLCCCFATVHSTAIPLYFEVQFTQWYHFY